MVLIGGEIMNKKPNTAFFVWFILATLLLPSCTSKKSEELLATINAEQFGNPREETQVALGLTQTAVEAIIHSASISTQAAPTALPTSIPPTAVPTEVPKPQPTPTIRIALIPASQASITSGGFEFRIAQLAFDNTVQGLAPKDMDANSHILFVEFELLSGAQEAFEALTILIKNGSGRSSEPIALISGGRVKVLATLTMTGESFQYEPDENRIIWAFVVPKNQTALYLIFPTGEVVDLSPLM